MLLLNLAPVDPASDRRSCVQMPAGPIVCVCVYEVYIILLLYIPFFYIDFLARMGVWNLDGVVWHRDLLPFVLQEKTIHDTLVMIVVDLSQPWNVLESLERWTEVVSKHVNSLKISEKQRKAMEEKSK